MNRLSSLFLTIAALLAAPAADAQHVDVTPRRIEVGFNKTVHILFPSPVTYIDIGSMDIIAGKAAGAENVVRVKAAVRDFPKETNLTVITEDGGYYSFDARYAENPQVATHEIGAATSASPAVQTPPAEGRVLLEATGRERPAVVKKTLNDIYRLNRTEMRLRKKHYGIETEVQGIYVRNDVIYIHLSLYNNSNISFEVEDLHFRIEDRKVAKRTAQQITPLELLRVCNDLQPRQRNLHRFHPPVRDAGREDERIALVVIPLDAVVHSLALLDKFLNALQHPNFDLSVRKSDAEVPALGLLVLFLVFEVFRTPACGLLLGLDAGQKRMAAVVRLPEIRRTDVVRIMYVLAQSTQHVDIIAPRSRIIDAVAVA